MVFQDTLYWIKFNIFFYILQIIVNIIVLVVINSINLERGMDDTLWFIMGNWYFWLTLLAICGLIGVPFYILRKSEFFFGGFIVNLILQNKIDNIYMAKYCQRKVEEMTRVNRSVAKFMKLYKNKDEATKIDNFADQQMKKIVDEFKVSRKRYKKKRVNRASNKNVNNIINNNINNNNNLNNNIIINNNNANNKNNIAYLKY